MDPDQGLADEGDDAAMTRICVAGMHRSGTSLIAGALQLAGVDLGPEEQLMSPKGDNPRGFFENLDVVQVNDDLLAQLGGSWQDPAPVPDGWHLREDIQSYRQRIRELVEQQFGEAEHVAWKDPRISLLLPVWVPDAGVGEVVLVLRDPRQVVRSLTDRSKLDEFQAARLWTRYTASLLRTWPRPVIVEYDTFLDDPVTALQDLCAQLSLPPPAPDALRAVRNLADPSLRHHTSHNVAQTGDMHEALRLLALVRHAPELARVEAGELYEQRMASAADDHPETRRLRTTLSILRERIELKDQQLSVSEQTLDDLRDGLPPQENDPARVLKNVRPALRHVVRRMSRLARRGR